MAFVDTIGVSGAGLSDPAPVLKRSSTAWDVAWLYF